MINLRQNKAFALTFTLIFMFLIVSFMAVYMLVIFNGITEATLVTNQKIAYYAADAGLVDAYERITKAGITTFASSTCTNTSIPLTCTAPFIPSTSTDNGVYSVGTASSGSYKVSIVYSSSPRANYVITSTGTFSNVSRTLQLKIIGATLATNAYWSNTEYNPVLGTVWWITGMLTIGTVETNGTLNIYGNPIFDGAVLEGGSTPNYYNSTSIPGDIFTDGLTNNSPEVSAPPAATLAAIKTTASDGSGLLLTGASTIIFNPAGTITVTGSSVVNGKTTTYKNTTMSPPSNGIIYVQNTTNKTDGSATVQGTVSGQLTVAADENINISGNVAYNSDPRTNPSSTDMLGLVANDNITVIEADAPSQLEVAGVLMALQGSFNVDQYSVNKDPIDGGSQDGAVMDQFGSLINDYRGPIGTFNTSTGKLVSGWSDNQDYDTRLLTTAPPGFPPYTNSAGNAVYTNYMHPQSISECVAGVCG